jgi:hypothetical protein
MLYFLFSKHHHHHQGLDHLECDMAEVMSHKMVGQSKMNESFITDILKNQSIPSEEEDIEYR